MVLKVINFMLRLIIMEKIDFDWFWVERFGIVIVLRIEIILSVVVNHLVVPLWSIG